MNDAVYRRFHDVIVPARNGTTQIDHVLVSCYGIFVVETKNYNGWIFGDEHAAQWTVSHFGPNAGKTFLGCKGFPRCRFVRSS